MKKFLIVGLFLTVIASHAQVKNFTVRLSAGLPVISSVESIESTNSLPMPAATGYSYMVLKGTIEQTFSNRSAIELGGQVDYSLSPKIFLTSGLSLNYIRYQRNVRIVKIDQSFEPTLTLNPPTSVVGAPFGSISFRDVNGDIVVNPDATPLTKSEDTGKTTAMSIQIPLLVGTSVLKNKLQLRVGPVFSYLLRATEIRPTYSNNVISQSKVSSKENFSELNAGLSVQTTFLISPRFGIDFSGQKFFSPIYDNTKQQSKAKYNLLMFGVSYHFN